MKIKYNNVIFDEFTIETKDGKVLDISKLNKPVSINDIKYAWGYICEKCARKANWNINPNDFKDIFDGYSCYGDNCINKKNINNIELSNDDIQHIEFINI